MQIWAINNEQKKISFKMNIKCYDKQTLDCLKVCLKDYYKELSVPHKAEIKYKIFNGEPFNFDKIYETFKVRFTEMTKDIPDGIVTIIKGENTHQFNTIYEDSTKKIQTPISKNFFNAQIILPNYLFDRKTPSSAGVRAIVADISDLIASVGVSNQDNKAYSLAEKLRNMDQ